MRGVRIFRRVRLEGWGVRERFRKLYRLVENREFVKSIEKFWVLRRGTRSF